MVTVPSTIDMTQNEEKFETPVIRVWCHPHYIGEKGEDYYYTFESFGQALDFIKAHPESERIPLVAINGYELNLFAIKPLEKDRESKINNKLKVTHVYSKNTRKGPQFRIKAEIILNSRQEYEDFCNREDVTFA